MAWVQGYLHTTTQPLPGLSENTRVHFCVKKFRTHKNSSLRYYASAPTALLHDFFQFSTDPCTATKITLFLCSLLHSLPQHPPLHPNHPKCPTNRYTTTHLPSLDNVLKNLSEIFVPRPRPASIACRYGN